MPELIDAAAIPGARLRPDMVDVAAHAMADIGDRMGTQAAAVVHTWHGLAEHYQAPEADALLRVMDPVGRNGEIFDANLDRVAAALHAYAAEVEPIKAELARIKSEAVSFRASVAGGVEQSRTLGTGLTTTVEWHEDPGAIAANNALIGRVHDQMELLWAAERRCASAIYDIIGFPPLEAASEANPDGYRLEDVPDGVALPWGTAGQRREACGEKLLSHTLWQGIVTNGIWGDVQARASLTFGYDPETGDLRWDAWTAAWSQVGMVGVGLVSAGPGLSQLPGPVGDFFGRGDEALRAFTRGQLALDTWGNDPWTAAGETLYNLLSLAVPGGVATAVVRNGSSGAARVVRGADRALAVADPIWWAGRGGSYVARASSPAVADLLVSFDFRRTAALIDAAENGVDLPTVARPGMTLETPRAERAIEESTRALEGINRELWAPPEPRLVLPPALVAPSRELWAPPTDLVIPEPGPLLPDPRLWTPDGPVARPPRVEPQPSLDPVAGFRDLLENLAEGAAQEGVERSNDDEGAEAGDEERRDAIRDALRHAPEGTLQRLIDAGVVSRG